MANAFIDKLCAHVDLSAADIGLLEAECANARDVPARHDLIREGDPSGPLFVILAGWACRYQILPQGARQITAFLMPGDCCDMHLAKNHIMDHSIATLTDSRVASIPRARFENLIAPARSSHKRYGGRSWSTRACSGRGSSAWAAGAASSVSPI